MQPACLDKAAGVWCCQAAPWFLTSLPRTTALLGVPSLASTHSYYTLSLPRVTLPTYKWVKKGFLHARAQLSL